MEEIVYKFCRECNLNKIETDFRPNRRVCKKCISKTNQIKYKDIVKQYYVTHQEEIIERSKEYQKKKIEKEGRKKLGRPRIINVDKPIEICKETSIIN